MSLFSFLGLPERVSLRLVSKHWCRALDDERNWRAVDFGAMGVAPPRGVPRLLRWVVTRYGSQIHDISTRGCYISDEAVQVIGQNCPNLEVLIVDEYVPERPDEEAAEREADALAASRGVGHLPLSEPVSRSPARRMQPNVRDMGIQALADCPHLTRLDASRCCLTDAAAISLANNHSFLSYIKLGSPALTDEGVCYLAEKSPELLALDVSGSRVTDASLRTIGLHCRRLRMLNAEGCSEITDEGIMALVAHCYELRILILSGCPLLTNDALSLIAQRCELLHRLDISHNPSIDDDGLDELAECCEELESLNVVRCPRVTGEGVTTILTDCPRLRQLHCEGVSFGPIVEELHPHCPSLTNVSLRRCGELSDLAINTIAHGCGNVTALDLAGNRITGFSHLAVGALVGKLRALRSLDLTGTGISDESLVFLTCRGPRLVRACVGGNPCVTDTGLEHVLTATGPHLLDLSLRECSITDEGLRSIADTAGNLTRLDITGCHRITDEGMDALAQGCTQLEVLLCGGGYPGATSGASSAVAQIVDSASVATGEDAFGEGDGGGSGSAKRKRRKRKQKKKSKESGGGEGDDGGTEETSAANATAPRSAEAPTSASTGGAQASSSSAVASKRAEDASDGYTGGSGEARGGGKGKKNKRRRRGKGGKGKHGPGMMQLSDATMESLTMYCHRLHSLHMPGCAGLSDEGLQILAESSLSERMVSLYFGGCNHLSVDGLLGLLDGCRRLALLSVPQCAGVSETDLETLLARGREHSPSFVLDPDVGKEADDDKKAEHRDQ